MIKRTILQTLENESSSEKGIENIMAKVSTSMTSCHCWAPQIVLYVIPPTHHTKLNSSKGWMCCLTTEFEDKMCTKSPTLAHYTHLFVLVLLCCAAPTKWRLVLSAADRHNVMCVFPLIGNFLSFFWIVSLSTRRVHVQASSNLTPQSQVSSTSSYSVFSMIVAVGDT